MVMSMLTQKQVNKIKILLALKSPTMKSRAQLDNMIAKSVGCNPSTISRIRRGVRGLYGKPEYEFHLDAVTSCPRCGIVPGTYCTMCAARDGVQNRRMQPLKPKHDELALDTKKKRGGGYARIPDPSSEEIADRAARLRQLRLAAMREVGSRPPQHS